MHTGYSCDGQFDCSIVINRPYFEGGGVWEGVDLTTFSVHIDIHVLLFIEQLTEIVQTP